jgi:release factor glutamine methyltransferase
MVRIDQLLQAAGQAGSSERVDAEVLLSYLLNKDRSYLYAWPEREVDQLTCVEFERQVGLLEEGIPVAYLVGEREFWSLSLEVDEHTLIPRPETELLVEWALELGLPRRAQVVDLGTGSGAIALALASERPSWQVLAADTSRAALAVARRNVHKLRLANVELHESDWLDGLGDALFSLIVSNPPYIAEGDPHLQQGGLPYEPPGALTGGIDGLDDIRRIIEAAPARLQDEAWLLLEHGYDQAERVRELLQAAGFVQLSSRRDLAGHERVSGGQWLANG